MKKVLLLVLCVSGLVACRKEPPPAPAAPPPANKVSVADSTTVAPPPAPGETSPPGAPADPAAKQDFAAAARMLTKGLKDYVTTKGKFPMNLEEMKAAGFIQTIPDPPGGMRWDFDRKKVEVFSTGYSVGL